MRILVAMSGGVDSSVVAGLLREAGHDVIGATLQLYDHGAAVKRQGSCCAGRDIHDARNVADMLGIPHYVIDAEHRFYTAVIEDFAQAYARGETPIPCVRCNQTVKFTDLLRLSADLGADVMATGHYVRRVDHDDGPELHQAVDSARDQSWFLFATTRTQLARSLFPLGEMANKAQVRAEAIRLGLRVAEKPDSQDLCFVPSGSYADLVSRIRPDAAEPGEIVTEAGVTVGRHQGVGRYTVGQTKRLGEAAIGGDGARQMVLAVDAARRRVVIGPRTREGSRHVGLRNVNWLCLPPADPLRAQVKLRAHDIFRPATVRLDGEVCHVDLDEPAVAAPGQACVF